MTLVESLQSAIIWYLAITLVSLLSYPITYGICRGLPDRGISLYRPLGIIFATLPLWWLGNLSGLPFSGATFLGLAVTVGVVAWGYALMRSGLLESVRARGRRLLTIEVATAILFFGYVLIRGFNPDIQGTEKPMELAFLNASIHAGSLPVPDPWFAGEPINYYYYGYAVLALFAKITGLPGGVTFTLGLATTFALATVAAGGLAANFAERLPGAPNWSPMVSGLLGGTLLMFAGNLHAVAELARSPSETLSAGWWDGIGWSSSRIIEDTGFPDDGTRTVISEFPAFSWILGDLHPHVLAYPWLVAAFALIANYVYLASGSGSRRDVLAGGAAIGLMIGVLYSANTWDVAIVGLLTVLALLFYSSATGWRTVAISAVVIGATAVLTVLPFAVNYTTAAGATEQSASGLLGVVPFADQVGATIGYVHWDRTTTGELLLAHGGFLVLALVVIAAFWRYRGTPDRVVLIASSIVAAVLLIGAMLLSTPALAVIGIPLIALLPLTLRSRGDVPYGFPPLLLVAGLTVVIALEYFYIRDPFGHRMNTIFKVYFALWALFSVVLAGLLPLAIRNLSDATRQVYPVLAVAFVVVTVLAMSVYTPLSAYRWYSEFQSWSGIDGTAYLERAQPGEAAAIDWLNDNAGGSDVVLEAPGCSYGSDNLMPHNRISMATGIPTVVGWDGHQFQWRRQQTDLLPEIGARVEQAGLIYENPTSPDSIALLDSHGVSYVIVGVHETQGYVRCDHGPPYDPEGLAAFPESGLDQVFEHGEIRIFAVRERDLVN